MAQYAVEQLHPSNIYRWKDDKHDEEVVDVEQEDCHRILIENYMTRVVSLKLEAGESTTAHRHMHDTIVVALTEKKLKYEDDIMGQEVQKKKMEFGAFDYIPYSSEPVIHKITNKGENDLHMVYVEVLKKAAVGQKKSLKDDYHELIDKQDNYRMYKFTLEPRKTAVVSNEFFYVRLVVEDASLIETTSTNSMKWLQQVKRGECKSYGPEKETTIKNVGQTTFVAYIIEFR